jgi:hypothetical protein
MAEVRVGLEINKILFNIDTLVDIASQNATEKISNAYKDDAIISLREGISGAKGSKSKGILESAISAKKVSLGTPGFARSDVVIDARRAPHFAWIDRGRNTPIGLPYSKKGGKNYRKSRFKGYKYLDKTHRKYLKSEITTVMVATEIVKEFARSKGVFGTRKVK